MCFHSKQSKTAQEVQNRFKARIRVPEQFKSSKHINGFNYEATPIITNYSPTTIEHFHWGLIPNWSKDEKIRQYTLNAKIETLTEKPSFKGVVHQRCLVIADGFYEWQWLDSKGKHKQKYEIGLATNELFCFGGLFSKWIDPNTNKERYTYTIVTREANELMSKIHNIKKRMPVILDAKNEKSWLEGESFQAFEKTKIELKANKIYEVNQNLSLF